MDKEDIMHLLFCLAEEAGEVAQIAGKTGRFGPYSTNPYSGSTLMNVDYIAGEINDILAVVELLREAGVQIPELGNRQAIDHKKAKVKMFMEQLRQRQ